MTKQFYWDGDTFGSGPIPKNWEEICDAVNDDLDVWASTNGANEEQLKEISAALWEYFCNTDRLPLNGIRAVWED
jgi:hypothetical protein